MLAKLMVARGTSKGAGFRRRAKKRQEEEAKKKREEEAPVGTGSVSKPKVKSLTRAQRLAVALKACHKKGRKQRAVCERQARRAYGSLHRKKK
jgi:hypothetical protein